MTLEKDAELKARAEKVIPNGMYGHEWVGLLMPGTPQFFSRAKGAYLWDVDDNRYVDFMCAYGPQLLGYGHPEVDAAYIDQLQKMDVGTGPTAHIVELAEKWVSMVDHADWAMFCKNGTDATTMALMAARAYRDKKKILIANGAYHGASNWCTPFPHGVTDEDRAHFISYTYNDVESLEAAVAEAGDDLAGIFASPFKHDVFTPQELPDPAYAKRARELCDEKDALLIVDEIRAGLRIARDASWSLIGVKPDLTSWGKSLANGHPISALLGSEKAKEAAGKIYVTGSFWFAGAAMAASLVTLKLVEETDYLERMISMGDRLRDGLDEIAKRRSIEISQSGPSQMPLIMFPDGKGGYDMDIGYKFCTGLLGRGVYFHPWHNMFISAAMTDADIDLTVQAADDTLAELLQVSAA
ncbi:aminotransferase class III-fold pyridoxal phosphate-dependent enzyme [Ponticaulis sp.]|uniref:aminotransferase class III-fold pyridoxal phosphate-dependent enzyme n=1 Tax=Ponticaulis sp. TaxID=2020902 RepID=UPI000B766B7A|nr:aminotransferase class III-fold pyridoxal phosphate-dependent enzyme [Ponticaulis sp.]MAI90044.1 glutamate-1-semialdehyde 2,1-aminomutase [Ponticaulis sp.]OUX99702.1 MAG: glutamate-1-semialdehyde 2,1-aminomutase [Hyphomonadaceae bacterium TMED5]|tara:strand:- start:47047 stop:48282 length:1236 start_codon:yes stop_codon:yes gene_type:complete